MIFQDFKKKVDFCEKLSIFRENRWFLKEFLQNLEKSVKEFCRFWKMLQNAYLDAKIGVDTAENEPRKEWCVVAS